MTYEVEGIDVLMVSILVWFLGAWAPSGRAAVRLVHGGPFCPPPGGALCGHGAVSACCVFWLVQ